jgi:hypothetical protein
MSDLPAQELDAQEILNAATLVIDALVGTKQDAAFGGCALASFMLYRSGRHVEQNMDLLEEYSVWLHAAMADLGGN